MLIIKAAKTQRPTIGNPAIVQTIETAQVSNKTNIKNVTSNKFMILYPYIVIKISK